MLLQQNSKQNWLLFLKIDFTLIKIPINCVVVVVVVVIFTIVLVVQKPEVKKGAIKKEKSLIYTCWCNKIQRKTDYFF